MSKTIVQHKRLSDVLEVPPFSMPSRRNWFRILLLVHFIITVLAFVLLWNWWANARKPLFPLDRDFLESSVLLIGGYFLIGLLIFAAVARNRYLSGAVSHRVEQEIKSYLRLVRVQLDSFVQRSAGSKKTRFCTLADGILVAYSARGLILADVIADKLTGVPLRTIRKIELVTRPSSEIHVSDAQMTVSAVSYNLSSQPLAPGAYLHGSARGRAVTVVDFEYATVLDLYLRDNNTPLLSLNFGSNEADAKEVRATLETAFEAPS